MGYEIARNRVQNQEIGWILHREQGETGGTRVTIVRQKDKGGLEQRERKQRSKLDLRHL